MGSKIVITALLVSSSITSAQQLVDNGFFPTLNDSLFKDTSDETSDSNSCGCQYGDGTFCGTDGQCHLYNCESFYEFGPLDFTGYYDSNASPELVCNDILTTPVKTAGDPSQASVAFRCRDLVPEPIGIGWTKYCEASSSNSNFTCYGLADNTDFTLFLQQTEASQLECNSGEYDETGYPAYTYSVSMRKRDGNSGHSIYTLGFNATQEFNETMALTGTMTTSFEAWTDQPTQSPISPPDNSSTGKSFFSARFTLVVGLIGLL